MGNHPHHVSVGSFFISLSRSSQPSSQKLTRSELAVHFSAMNGLKNSSALRASPKSTLPRTLTLGQPFETKKVVKRKSNATSQLEYPPTHSRSAEAVGGRRPCRQSRLAAYQPCLVYTTPKKVVAQICDRETCLPIGSRSRTTPCVPSCQPAQGRQG